MHMKSINPLLFVATLVGAALFLSPVEAEAADGTKPVKVFILAGQSNMQGYGFISAGKDGDLEYAAKNGFDLGSTSMKKFC